MYGYMATLQYIGEQNSWSRAVCLCLQEDGKIEEEKKKQLYEEDIDAILARAEVSLNAHLSCFTPLQLCLHCLCKHQHAFQATTAVAHRRPLPVLPEAKHLLCPKTCAMVAACHAIK